MCVKFGMVGDDIDDKLTEFSAAVRGVSSGAGVASAVQQHLQRTDTPAPPAGRAQMINERKTFQMKISWKTIY